MQEASYPLPFLRPKCAGYNRKDVPEDMTTPNRRPVFCAILWSLLFALMSFYWAGGGEQHFVQLVWLTGAVKLLHMIQVLNLSIGHYAAWWRFLFWEPFWMLGGLLYMLSGLNFARRLKN
ncbi:hypothetical protein [Paenibacillus beijingensis]|uniref:Uncharacterized protein n=1 Tax=Paenibacillus beijingensis TaxID=1126833 RepID=A0A0D5NND5_9BACL|nr:hypothetical protein [Paenibacillus beijingensis]AJY76650.1 hypothetical protein VN24_21315 [Paenibacillus beijingensis]